MILQLCGWALIALLGVMLMFSVIVAQRRRKLNFPSPGTLILPLPVEVTVTRQADDALLITWE
ncbi:MAG: hypothetical protein K8I60_15680, partial [Anaerolineae bacterium]|nr:hypothetical protein [Anaerolineae bacterium]